MFSFCSLISGFQKAGEFTPTGKKIRQNRDAKPHRHPITVNAP
jgi:hypothetical protein